MAASFTTSERFYLGVALPPILNTAITEMAADEHRSISSVVRLAIDWHRGEGRSRSPESKQYTLPKLKKKPPKNSELFRTSFAIDPPAVEYLQQIGSRIGLPKSSMIIIVLLDYFDILDLSPIPKTSKQ